MLRFDRYARPTSPEEAHALLQEERFATVLGGTMWLRLSDRTVPLAIDISGLGLTAIEETAEHFVLGAMTSLSDIECHEALTRQTHGILRDAVRDIVGRQFRNLATVGGSVWARMGFSDVVTALAVLPCELRLVGAHTMPLINFVEHGAGRDLLTHVLIRRTPMIAAFESVRVSATDFSAINVAAARWDGTWHVAVGARPQRCVLVEAASELPAVPTEADLDRLAAAVDDVSFGSDRRASAEWRRRTAPELVRRAVTHALEGGK